MADPGAVCIIVLPAISKGLATAQHVEHIRNEVDNRQDVDPEADGADFTSLIKDYPALRVRRGFLYPIYRSYKHDAYNPSKPSH
jgi:hypothetical protein